MNLEPVALVLCVAARLAGMLLLLPAISATAVSWRIRLVLWATLTAATASVLARETGTSLPTQASLGPAMLYELGLGAAVSMGPAAMLWGLQLAAHSVAGMTGLGMQAAPSELTEEGGVLPRCLTVFAWCVFFVSGGHRHVLTATLHTFSWLPAGQAALPWRDLSLLLEVLGQSFAFGVRVAAPIAFALTVSLVTLAALQRVMPQLGYFAMGMSVQTLVLFGALVCFVGSMGLMLQTGFEGVSPQVTYLLREAVNRP